MAADVQQLVSSLHIMARLVVDVLEGEIIRDTLPQSLNRNQVAILRILYNVGSKSVRELAQLVDTSDAAASKNVDKLVNLEMVSRVTPPEDRRQATISILKTGIEYLNLHDEQWLARQSEILAEFSPDDMDRLTELVDKYIRGCLREDRSVELICLQCGAAYDQNCTICMQRGFCTLQRS